MWSIVRWKCEFEGWLKLRYDWSLQLKIHISNRFLGVFVQSNGCVAAVHIEHLLWNMLITPKSCSIFSFTFGCKLSFRSKESKVIFFVMKRNVIQKFKSIPIFCEILFVENVDLGSDWNCGMIDLLNSKFIFSIDFWVFSCKTMGVWLRCTLSTYCWTW